MFGVFAGWWYFDMSEVWFSDEAYELGDLVERLLYPEDKRWARSVLGNPGSILEELACAVYLEICTERIRYAVFLGGMDDEFITEGVSSSPRVWCGADSGAGSDVGVRGALSIGVEFWRRSEADDGGDRASDAGWSSISGDDSGDLVISDL
jgi:hypothetical protein